MRQCSVDHTVHVRWRMTIGKITKAPSWHCRHDQHGGQFGGAVTAAFFPKEHFNFEKVQAGISHFFSKIHIICQTLISAVLHCGFAPHMLESCAFVSHAVAGNTVRLKGHCHVCLM